MSTDTDDAPPILAQTDSDTENHSSRERLRKWLKYGLVVALLSIGAADVADLSGNVDTIAMALGLTLMVVGLLRTRPKT